ncbi:hypothetical protein [Hafnia alvei]|uniref:hypothetical protein n=1 Tax=Hafnia alvei TaxID=569 RepID=UPI00396CA8E7
MPTGALHWLSFFLHYGALGGVICSVVLRSWISPLVSFGGVVAGTDSLACGLGSAYTSHATSASLRISLRIHHTPKPT